MADTELEPSELGTQNYWKEAYLREIGNFEEHGDPGEVWFGEDSAFRVVDWVCKCGISKDTPIVDLGCGNGYTLCQLQRSGFTNLLGVDYCSEAVTLAGKVAGQDCPEIQLKVFDITKDAVKDLGTFGLVHDKGTYDAISLNPDNPKENRLKYICQVYDMLQEGGLFLITSCNWTESELKSHFESKFKIKCIIPSPQFKFGGKTGSMVSSVVFYKDS